MIHKEGLSPTTITTHAMNRPNELKSPNFPALPSYDFIKHTNGCLFAFDSRCYVLDNVSRWKIIFPEFEVQKVKNVHGLLKENKIVLERISSGIP